MPSNCRAVLLDRDGVINSLVHYADSNEWESPRSPGDVTILPGALEALRELAKDGWGLAVVSNQPSHAKGKITLEALETVHAQVVAALREGGRPTIPFFYCYHHPQAVVPELRMACDCRKPRPGLILRAMAELGADPNSTWVVGDQDTDAQAATSAGCRAVLLAYPRSSNRRAGGAGVKTYDSIGEATMAIIKEPDV